MGGLNPQLEPPSQEGQIGETWSMRGSIHDRGAQGASEGGPNYPNVMAQRRAAGDNGNGQLAKSFKGMGRQVCRLDLCPNDWVIGAA